MHSVSKYKEHEAKQHLYLLGMDVVQEQGESASCCSSSISTSSDDPALKPLYANISGRYVTLKSEIKFVKEKLQLC